MCLFCKIIKREIPAEIIYEDDQFLAFKDINPKADQHLLVIPKEHLDSIQTLQTKDKNLISELIFTAKKIAEQAKMEGYKLHFNVGEKGGQIIFHLHLHLLSGTIKGIV